jgi:2,3-diketo-5-methylthiopentyl-1-phosphate enolase
VKDDEVRIDVTLEHAKRRLDKVLSAGRGRGRYITALNGPAFELKTRAMALQGLGAQGFLVCPYTYGVSVLQSLCECPEIQVPIYAHPAFTGVMTNGASAIEPAVCLGTLMRWAGADGVLFPSPYGKIALTLGQAKSVHEALTRNEGALKMCASIPSAGILPKFVAEIRKDFGVNVVVNAGTGMAQGSGGDSGGKSVAAGADAFLHEIGNHF